MSGQRRSGIAGWLQHAFAVDPPGAAEPNEVQRRIVDRVCRSVAGRGLAQPALLYLEVARPLNYLSAQAMHFFRPIVTALLSAEEYDEFAAFLEKRGSVDYLVAQLEHFEQQYETRRSRGGEAPASHSDDEEGTAERS